MESKSTDSLPCLSKALLTAPGGRKQWRCLDMRLRGKGLSEGKMKERSCMATNHWKKHDKNNETNNSD